jgi:hypothetical protein
MSQAETKDGRWEMEAGRKYVVSRRPQVAECNGKREEGRGKSAELQHGR